MEWIKNTVVENFGGPVHDWASSENAFKLEETPDLSGKVAVVTGGSEGTLLCFCSRRNGDS